MVRCMGGPYTPADLAGVSMKGNSVSPGANTALVNPKIFARQIMQLRQQLQKHHQEVR